MLNLRPWSLGAIEEFDPSSVSLVSLCAAETTVSVLLNCDSRKHVALFFSRVVAHRRTAEEALQQFWREFHKRIPNPHSAFWMADRAGWIQALGADHWDHRNLATHHVVMTDESLIEVVSEREPIVVINDL